MDVSQKKGVLAMVLCASLWSTAGLFIKLINWNALVLGGFRGAIAAMILWFVLWRLGHPIPAINRNTLLTGLFLGVTCSLFVMANKLTTAANAIMLQSANPVFVLLFTVIFKRVRITKRDMLVVAVVLMGVTLFFLDELSPGNLLGNILALISAATIATAFFFACDADSLYETMSGVLLGQLFSAVLGLPFIFLYPPDFTPAAVGAVLFLGVFQLGIPYTLFAISARYCPPLAISLLGMLEPIFSPVWVALVLHEVPGPLPVAGGIVVIITLALWCSYNARHTVK